MSPEKTGSWITRFPSQICVGNSTVRLSDGERKEAEWWIGRAPNWDGKMPRMWTEVSEYPARDNGYRRWNADAEISLRNWSGRSSGNR